MECNPKPASSPPPPLLWDWDAAASPGDASGPASAGKRRREGEEREAKKGMAEGGEAEARCQVEGCGLELRGAKEYHRKHRVCEAHSKCPRVVIAGQERRFCQQCSRFHALSEFDQKKRSCRRRLSDHNARRRKPQPDAFSFGSSGLPSSLFDDRGQISFVWNKAPFSHVRPFTYSSWDSLSDFKLSQVIEIGGKSTKGAATNGQVPLAKSHLSNSFSAFHHDTDELLPIKGLDASGTGSKIDGALDVRRALSLLSANSWDSTGSVQQASSLIQFTAANENSRTPPVSHGGNTTSAFWVDRQPLPPQSQVVQFTMDTSSNTFQDLEQLKPAYDSTFFSMNQIH